MMNLFIRFRHCEDGATLVEYGIALGLAVTLGAGALVTLGTDIGLTMGDASAAMPRTPTE
ncbi:Flp family type IVb pilin [Sulfitobacter sabulilitoris]|uniref:Flp family type IVb pilin n=1 Tax=Sulfitobacter sabulilitoris TaxID=2562655 RepID=A0A5S3PMH5_9RHOB|nr:Flp family type IVb pilin [Sulfitobacter sabulilitoris]